MMKKITMTNIFEFEKIQLEENLGKVCQVNWQKVSDMFGYLEKKILERQSFSEVQMGRRSPIYEKNVPTQIVEQINNVTQCKIMKTLNMLSSTVHNIIKRVKECGEMSVSKVEGEK